MPFASNLGSGGAALNAQYGSSTAANNNAPLLLSHTGTNYVYVSGVNNNYVIVPRSDALAITGDVDIRVQAALDNWTSGLQIIAGTWYDGLSGFGIRANSDGTLGMTWCPLSGGNAVVSSSVSHGIPSGVTKWVRATLDVDNGAGQYEVKFFLSDDGVAWTQLGITRVFAGTTSIKASTQPFVVGSHHGFIWNATGKFFRAQVLNGINGTTALDVDFTTGISTGAQTSLPISGTAANQIDSAQVLTNLGTGGPTLNAQVGSAVTTTSNDPTILRHTGTNYLYLPGVQWNAAIVPDEAALDIAGDIDLRVLVELDSWTPSAFQTLIGKSDNTLAGQSYLLQMNTNGRPRLLVTDSTLTNRTYECTAAPTPPSAGTALWLRATLDVDDGAGGSVATFYTSNDGASWTQLGTTVPLAATFSINVTTTSVVVGAYGNGQFQMAAGKFRRAQILNGIGGTVVFDADFTTGITNGNQTSFTATTGQTVTINRSASGLKAVAVTRPTLLFGTDDYLEVANNDLLNFGPTDSFTVMAAVRQWATPPSGGMFMAKMVTGSLGWYLCNTGTAFGATMSLADLDTQASPTTGSGVLASYANVVNRTSGTAVTYANGTPGTVDSSLNPAAVLTNSSPLRIGRFTVGSATYNDMEFFGAAVWRRALSETEIALVNTHYQTGPTTASLALLAEAVLWIDPMYSKSAAAIVRSTSGRRSVAVTRNTWLIGGDGTAGDADYFEIADNSLLDVGASDSFSVVAAVREWPTIPALASVVSKKATATSETIGWSLYQGTSGVLNPRISDGANAPAPTGLTPSAGQLTTLGLVRNAGTDQLFAVNNTTISTATADSTTGNLSNSEVVRIGRLSGAGTSYFNGELYGVAAFRRALTAEEIKVVSDYYSEPVLQAPNPPQVFSPLDLSPALWLDASDTSTITASSGAVSEWRDKSGNARHMAMGVAANQPSTGTRTINGLNVIDFDGGTDYLDTASFTLDQPITVCIVVKRDVASATAFSSVGGSFQAGWGASKRSLFCGKVLASSLDSNTNLQLETYTANGASSTIHVNGTSVGSGDAGTSGTSTGFRTAERNLVDRSDMALAEVVVYGSALSASDRGKVETYLKDKWGTP